MKYPEPTAQQCTRCERITLGDGVIAMALWYPQMGGYSGKALAVPAGSCVDVYVWHDGEFPFRGEGQGGVQPVELHFCDPEQFVLFGKQLQKFLDGQGVPE